MNQLARINPRSIARFNPAETLEKTSVLESAIDHAKRMRDWQALDEAIEWLIDEQKNFVAWWKANVAKVGNPQLLQSGNNCRLSVKQAETKTKITAVQTSRWRTRLERLPAYRQTLRRPSYKQAMADPQNRADLQTGVMEWFTPKEYIDKARRVMGGIDLDPASSKKAQKKIKAKQYFTAHDDGLIQEWRGRVWLNPPYAGALIAAFSAKMIEEITSQNVSSAIMLTNAYTETSWFHNLTKLSTAICLTKGRIKFESLDGDKRSPTNGQCFFYFGNQEERFCNEFSDVGVLLKMAPI